MYSIDLFHFSPEGDLSCEAMAPRSTGKEPNSVATGGALMRERFIGTAPGKATSKANVGFWQTSLPQCE